MTSDSTPWPHAPPHRLLSPGTYMVTSGTYLKDHLFNTADKRNMLQDSLFTLASQFQWQLEAWAIFSNHYHFIGYSQQPETLKELIRRLHGGTSFKINRIDKTPGRQVWHQYRDSHITIQTSHYARLNYVHNNPVKHGLVDIATNYPWCSAAWLERTSTASYVKTITSFPIDKLEICDEF